MDLLAAAAETASLSSPSRPGHLPRARIDDQPNTSMRDIRSPALDIYSKTFADEARTFIFIPQGKDKNPKALQVTASGRAAISPITNKGSKSTAPMPVFIELPVATFAGIPLKFFTTAPPPRDFYPPPVVTVNTSDANITNTIWEGTTKRKKKRKHVVEEVINEKMPEPVIAGVERKEEDTSPEGTGRRYRKKSSLLATRRSTRAVAIDYLKLNDPNEELAGWNKEDLIGYSRNTERRC